MNESTLQKHNRFIQLKANEKNCEKEISLFHQLVRSVQNKFHACHRHRLKLDGSEK